MRTRQWHLSALPLKRLFSNHLNRDTEARSRDSIKSSTFLAESCGILLSAKFAISMSYVKEMNLLKNVQ